MNAKLCVRARLHACVRRATMNERMHGAAGWLGWLGWVYIRCMRAWGPTTIHPRPRRLSDACTTYYCDACTMGLDACMPDACTHSICLAVLLAGMYMLRMHGARATSDARRRTRRCMYVCVHAPVDGGINLQPDRRQNHLIDLRTAFRRPEPVGHSGR